MRFRNIVLGFLSLVYFDDSVLDVFLLSGRSDKFGGKMCSIFFDVLGDGVIFLETFFFVVFFGGFRVKSIGFKVIGFGV